MRILSPDEQAYHYTIEQQVAPRRYVICIALPHHKAIGNWITSKPFIHLYVPCCRWCLVLVLNIPDRSHPVRSCSPYRSRPFTEQPKCRLMSLIGLAQTDFEACCQRLDNLLPPFSDVTGKNRQTQRTHA
ncbi:hypothetical protein O9992_23310 [Vibrio lentus]|nr:hypothetical protein [Vibrio lentus]